MVSVTNESLALMIQSGHHELIESLWLQTEPLIKRIVRKWYKLHEDDCRKTGTTLDDVQQEAFFALLEAVYAYRKEEQYKLTTYLTYHLKNAFNTLAGHRNKTVLNNSLSLDMPLNTDEEGNELTMADIVPDRKAADSIEETERAIYNKQLRADLKTAIESLSGTQKEIIEQRYYKGLTMADIARERQTTPSKIASINKKALFALSKDKVIRERYRQDVISAHAYRGSFSAWKYSGYSSTENTVLNYLLDNARFKHSLSL